MPSRENHSANVARVRAAENRLKAFELYKAGATYVATGKALGVSHMTARKYVLQVLDRLAAESVALAEPYRNLQLERLQDMTFAYWPAMKRGDPAAGAMLIRIMEREAKLLGLDAPTKIDVEARIRQMAEREGYDPDEAVAEAIRWIKETRD